MKKKVKCDPKIIEKFEEYGVPLSEIDNISVELVDLEVSAKTKDQKIYINKNFIEKGQDPTDYLVHEIIHYLAQHTGDIEPNKNKKEYLDRDGEIEAFKAQVDYKKRKESPDEAEDYVDGLLDYHDIHGKEREEKKKELMEEK